MKKLHYFVGQKSSPYHVSVGAVVVRADGSIACQKFSNAYGKTDVYTLMRETVRPNESLEIALERGLNEELSVKGGIKKYLGSFTSSFVNWEGVAIQKTTLYFLCEFKDTVDTTRAVKKDFDEKESVVEWHDKNFLIEAMKKQGKILGRSDMDESEILQRI